MTSELCEVYHESSNKWTALPPLTNAKQSVSLEILNQKYLYCFGGLSPPETDNEHPSSIDDIEMLDLTKAESKWELLKVKIPIPSYDLGVFQISPTSVLVCGGFNDKYGLSKLAFVMSLSHEDLASTLALNSSAASLFTADYFHVTGTKAVMNDRSDQVLICGQKALHAFNLKTMCFEGVPEID